MSPSKAISNQALPRETRQRIEANLQDCRNLGLILDKYAPWQPVESRASQPVWDLVMNVRRRSRDSQPSQMTGGQAKGLWLSTPPFRRQPDESAGLFEEPRLDADLLKERAARWRRSVEERGGKTLTMTSSSRLLVGFGASHVLETTLALDRNTGAPIIPGSSLKGLTRAYCLLLIARQIGVEAQMRVDSEPVAKMLDDFVYTCVPKIEGVNPQGERSYQGLLKAIAKQLGISLGARQAGNDTDNNCYAIEFLDDFLVANISTWPVVVPPDSSITDLADLVNFFRLAFGTQGYAGTIVFVDGVYSGQELPVFTADVMTPHFVKYYTGESRAAPTDDQEPNPISFLALEAGAQFSFGLIARNADAAVVLPVVENLLASALRELGIGGKTSAGYGSFL